MWHLWQLGQADGCFDKINDKTWILETLNVMNVNLTKTQFKLKGTNTNKVLKEYKTY